MEEPELRGMAAYNKFWIVNNTILLMLPNNHIAFSLSGHYPTLLHENFISLLSPHKSNLILILVLSSLPFFASHFSERVDAVRRERPWVYAAKLYLSILRFSPVIMDKLAPALPRLALPSTPFALTYSSSFLRYSTLFSCNWFFPALVGHSHPHTNMLFLYLNKNCSWLSVYSFTFQLSSHFLSFHHCKVLQKSCLHFLSPFLFLHTFISAPVCCLLSSSSLPVSWPLSLSWFPSSVFYTLFNL